MKSLITNQNKQSLSKDCKCFVIIYATQRQTFTRNNTMHLENPTIEIKLLKIQKKCKIIIEKLYKWNLYNTDKKLYITKGIYRSIVLPLIMQRLGV